MTAYKVVDEVLTGRFLLQFEKWCVENDREIPVDLKDDMDVFRESIANGEVISDASQGELYERIGTVLSPLIDEFRKHGRSISPTFRFWDDFLQTVSLPLKLFVSSSRSGNWNVNQYAKCCFLPLLFASNRSTYAKYLTVQLLKMNRLPHDVEDGFNEGLFVGKLSDGNFNEVWIDYLLEVTENKALKGKAGIIGLTLRGNALARWFLSRPVTSKYSMSFHKNVCLSSTKRENMPKLHHSDTKFGRKRYNDICEKMDTMFNGTFIDPFDTTDYPAGLANFGTGVEAPRDIQDSLINCLVKGMESAVKFVEERLTVSEEADKPAKSFFDPLPRSRVKTMTDMKKRVVVKSRQVLINGDVMYQRLLAMNAYKKIQAERVFSFENTPVPLSLFSDTGDIISCKKSDFMAKLEGLMETTVTSIGSADCIIFDGMSVIQMLTPATNTPTTFMDMANSFLKYTLMKARSIRDVKEIHIVFDRYIEDSLKMGTRAKRGDTHSSHAIHIQGNLSIPRDWKAFLALGVNTDSLTSYYTGYILENASNELEDDETLFVSGGRGAKAFQATVDTTNEVGILESNQEEADTRMLLHATYAVANGAETIVVNSPDTDVLVLLLHHFSDIHAKRIYFRTGRMGVHTDLSRVIPVHELLERLTPEQIKIMLPIYCITGCDTCSYFFGKGKKAAFRIMMANADSYQCLSDFGSEPGPISKDHTRACVVFVGALYGKKDCQSINNLRTEKANKSIKQRNLPPTENSLLLHCMRCAYQLLVWRNALYAKYELPLPTNYGYEYDEERKFMKPIFMSQPVAAPELLNNMVCECEVCDDECTCFINSQPCTSACKCNASIGDSDESMCTNEHTIRSVMGDMATDSDEDNA